jgi:hypothetical protein
LTAKSVKVLPPGPALAGEKFPCEVTGMATWVRRISAPAVTAMAARPAMASLTASHRVRVTD